MLPNCILAYVGPETVLPLASILAAACGFFLLIWSRVRRAFAWMWSAVSRRKDKVCDNRPLS
jgi:hypothetical protein